MVGAPSPLNAQNQTQACGVLSVHSPTSIWCFLQHRNSYDFSLLYFYRKILRKVSQFGDACVSLDEI